MKPIFPNSKITEEFLTENVKYFEFNHIAEFAAAFSNFQKENVKFLYHGKHRLEKGKWIIVLETLKKN